MQGDIRVKMRPKLEKLAILEKATRHSEINKTMKSTILVLHVAYWTLSLFSCTAFAPHPIQTARAIHSVVDTRLASYNEEGASFIDNFVSSVTKGYDTFQKAKGEGYNFKQSVAIAIAGEYDEELVKNKIQDEIDSAPVVMFTWEASPACKKAIHYLNVAGAKYKVVRLDDPWSEGNQIRAELGKRVGRSSVPCIFIGGKYVGGFDGGVGQESPGILEMAFKGTLREKLEEVQALS